MLKNDAAAVQLHFLSGNLQLAQSCLPGQGDQHTPVLRISQRMRLEKSQLEGVDRRIQVSLLLLLLWPKNWLVKKFNWPNGVPFRVKKKVFLCSVVIFKFEQLADL